jgi:hypothetical protein
VRSSGLRAGSDGLSVIALTSPVLEALEERTLLSYSFTLIADTSGAIGDLSRFTPSLNSEGVVGEACPSRPLYLMPSVHARYGPPTRGVA